MGIELVKSVIALHGGLNGNQYKVLIAMAWQALDKPKDGRPAALYWGGWEPLGAALGYGIGDKLDAGSRVAQERVRQAMKGLAKAGLIEPLNVARRGTRQSYRLWITPFPTVIDGGSKAEGSPSESEGGSPSESEGSKPLGNRGISPSKSEGPRTQKDIRGDLMKDEHDASRTHVQRGRPGLWITDGKESIA